MAHIGFIPIFCIADIPNSTINDLLALNADETLGCKFILVKSMEASSFVLLDAALPVDGSSHSAVPNEELEALGTSLSPINTKIKEAGVIAPETLDAKGVVATGMFGVLDDCSIKDQTMLLVKQEYDFARDAEGQIIRPNWGEPEDDVLTWQTLRIYFHDAMGTFTSFLFNQVRDHKDGGTCYDVAGVYRAYRSRLSK